MKQFKSKAKKSLDEAVEGILNGESKDEVIDKINEMGLLPIEISEMDLAQKKSGSEISRFPILFGKLKSKDLAIFYGQLSKLTHAGVPILKALHIISEQSESALLRKVVEHVEKSVKEGQTLSASLARFPKLFSSFDIAMVQTGESVGRLEDALGQLVKYLEEREALASKVRAALSYPIFMVAMGIATVFAMVTFVIPKFSAFFEDLGQELPVITKILISVSYWCEKSWMLLIGGFLLLAWFWKLMLRSKSERRRIDFFVLSLPKIGILIRKYEIARLAKAMHLLLSNKMPVLAAVRIASPIIRNEAIRSDIDACYKLLEEGKYLSEGLRQSRFFPPFVSQLISIGEESAKLEESFKEISEWYEKDTSQTIQVFTNLLEPIVILVVGSMLGLIIIAVLMPVFTMSASF